jgi:hypothetical protein
MNAPKIQYTVLGLWMGTRISDKQAYVTSVPTCCLPNSRAAGETAGRVSRLATQRNVPLVYVDYIESAPWNIKLLAEAGGQKTRTMIATACDFAFLFVATRCPLFFALGGMRRASRRNNISPFCTSAK